MTDERLQDIESSFRALRAGFKKYGAYGVGPDWEHVYAGEELLAEVKLLREEVAQMRLLFADRIEDSAVARAAVLAEREACAEACDAVCDCGDGDCLASRCAAAIRERGKS